MSQRSLLEEVQTSDASNSIPATTVEILPPGDVLCTLRGLDRKVTTTILDPWYNKGVGGLRDDYEAWLREVVHAAAPVSDHVFVWGFPEIVHCVLRDLPRGWELVAWLTWYYKNCPSVIRGWRSAQNACLHLAKKGAQLYPQHFLNPAQISLRDRGKLRYMPGPANVIEVPLNVGFVGRSEQTGHPSQKPLKAIEPLVLMTTVPGDSVLDPMCGSGTTGAVCQALGRNAFLSDESVDYLDMVEKRLARDAQHVVTRHRSTVSEIRRPAASLAAKKPGRSRRG